MPESKEFKDLDSEGDAVGSARVAKGLWVPALSNFSVQYNFAVIAIALKIMDEEYEQTAWIKEMLKGVVFAGAITGQLVMGYVGDLLGRNKALSATIGLAAIGSLGSALFPWGDRWSVYGILATCRFILGVGVGGVYPLSATKAAEESETTDLQARNLRVSLAFFWQTPGAMFPYIMTLLLITVFVAKQLQFRLLFAIGAIPSFFILYATMNQRDSSEFRKVDDDQVSTLQLLRDKSNWRKLLATGGCWLIYDVVYYGTALFSPTIVSKIFGDSDVKKEAWTNVIVSSAGLPALALGIMCQQRFGTKKLQVWGFVFIAFCFLLLGILYKPYENHPNTIFGLYIILLFSLNFGPNITTFILPAEVYPPKVRSTMNGVSAALGKVGAIIGTLIYQPIYESFGMSTLMIVAGLIAVAGAVLSFAAVVTKDSQEFVRMTPGGSYTPIQQDD
eukprot:CAMPEP_0114497024 /NCGR_PEP_ID=MMETSP0109-20121206/6089_1 /TAXON_ID=29199 /ORGANISM="Chlorarachnion reptans, Strain CCCM449" /LENGTH=446 /DNA_ID=CAMNT_0001674349 /DNA_START=159 /DNA_END=1499 /DNA_ORIENTATION=+